MKIKHIHTLAQKNKIIILQLPILLDITTDLLSLLLYLFRSRIDYYYKYDHKHNIRVIKMNVCWVTESAATNDPKICRASKRYGKAAGGDQVFILVEKVSKSKYITKMYFSWMR